MRASRDYAARTCALSVRSPDRSVMPYVPPHLRKAAPPPADDPPAAAGGKATSSGGSSLEALLASQDLGGGGARPRFGDGGRHGKGKGKGGDRNRPGGRRDGPCAITPTQMTLHRPCACTLDAVADGASLIGTAAEFCDAFWHVRETPEGGLPLSCLRHPGECEGRNTVIVARLDNGESEPPLFTARFHNKDKNHHAERVMMEDRSLLAALRALPPPPEASATDGGCEGRRLRVYISLQPCHHSSSTMQISCTRDLFRFHEAELLPRRVALELVVAYPYRSHWEPGTLHPSHPARAPLTSWLTSLGSPPRLTSRWVRPRREHDACGAHRTWRAHPLRPALPLKGQDERPRCRRRRRRTDC